MRSICGMYRTLFENDDFEENEVAGIATGLAWTQYGGEILSIEASLSKGKGKVTLSGRLGDVMKESVGAALSYLKVHVFIVILQCYGQTSCIFL